MKAKRLALVLAFGLITGPAVANDVTKASTVGAKASAERGAAMAAPVGKPRPPITLRHEFLANPRLGEPLQVRLELGVEGGASGSIELELRTDEGLDLHPAGTAKSVTITEARRPVDLTLQVVPRRPGLAYLHVIARMPDAARGRVARAWSIPVMLGEGASRPAPKGTAGEIRFDEAGRPLHVMPAESRKGGD